MTETTTALIYKYLATTVSNADSKRVLAVINISTRRSGFTKFVEVKAENKRYNRKRSFKEKDVPHNCSVTIDDITVESTKA